MFIIALSGIFGYGIPFEHVRTFSTGRHLGDYEESLTSSCASSSSSSSYSACSLDVPSSSCFFTPIFLPLVRELSASIRCSSGSSFADDHLGNAHCRRSAYRV